MHTPSNRIKPCGELMPPGLFGSTTIDCSACTEKANTRGTTGATGVPILMSAANSSGGVMGKMIDAQSIVEGTILRFVFWHSIALACLVGGLVMLQAYVPPFTSMVY